jgi:hypothetical protein
MGAAGRLTMTDAHVCDRGDAAIVEAAIAFIEADEDMWNVWLSENKEKRRVRYQAAKDRLKQAVNSRGEG